MRKVFVEVTARHTTDGQTVPVSLTWENGRTYTIDRVFDSCKAASLKVGGQGVRYRCKIRGKETFLWKEEEKWFVEAK